MCSHQSQRSILALRHLVVVLDLIVCFSVAYQLAWVVRVHKTCPPLS